MSKARLLLGVSLAALLVFSFFGESLVVTRYAYYYDIFINIGINIILAVSLNLVNGYTGQFSLGHAGFMADGADAAARSSHPVSPLLLHPFGCPPHRVA